MIEIKEKTGYIVTSVERSEGDKFVLEEGSIILGYEPLYSGTDEERFRDGIRLIVLEPYTWYLDENKQETKQ